MAHDGLGECGSRVRVISPPSLIWLKYAPHCRILRREPQLTQFETAQLANLCPAEAEEAKSIIPRCVQSFSVHNLLMHPLSSLEDKVDDDRLQALLNEIQTMRKFQT